MTTVCITLVAACFAAIAILKKRGEFLWDVLPNDEVWEIPVRPPKED